MVVQVLHFEEALWPLFTYLSIHVMCFNFPMFKEEIISHCNT